MNDDDTSALIGVLADMLSKPGSGRSVLESISARAPPPVAAFARAAISSDVGKISSSLEGLASGAADFEDWLNLGILARYVQAWDRSLEYFKRAVGIARHPETQKEQHLPSDTWLRFTSGWRTGRTPATALRGAHLSRPILGHGQRF